MGILAQTPSGLIPIVRQFRPAVERYTWELPAGLVDPGEAPVDTCRRELMEETGLMAREIKLLGAHYTEVGRLENLHHAFYVEASEPDTKFIEESGLEVVYVTPFELREKVRNGEICNLPHIATISLGEGVL